MEADETREKAKAFFSLWQEQMATLMRDPEAMNNAVKQMLVAQQAFYSTNTTMKQNDDAKSRPTAAATSLAPDAELIARLAECEARIAELESKLAGRGKPTRRTTGKNPASHAA